MEYGYICVTPDGMDGSEQRGALIAAGIAENNIYKDDLHGKEPTRPQFERLFGDLRAGDLLIVSSIDRLGNDYPEMIQKWRKLRERGVDIKMLDMPLLDTRLRGSDLDELDVSDIVIQLLSYMSKSKKVKRDKLRNEGIKAAKQRGVQFGKKRIELPGNFNAVYRNYRNGKISADDAAVQCGMSQSTFYRRAKEIGDGGAKNNSENFEKSANAGGICYDNCSRTN